ncbi:Riboflavin transporter MCH5 [Colletotrichum higginsianum IMI 349063]|uniref:Riboflavin transporter MCH5 n=1 Tax=Colletotrichum higginsianum (strain IMI 349063) TaxID=759273 RepID=A0A1B7XQP3_COLHI|nr:Riboflavin transporter MCH5 [Colletotrichum higginsianum IMI 349063]OBR02044.1 Riboflavin transporter MCH5 [Colletotrichum higginsianum IMI 349063]
MGIALLGGLAGGVVFPPKPLYMARALPDPMILRNPALCLTAMGAFFMEWGLFVPLSYLTLYALGHGQS